jgi:hypothetical protein
MSDSAQAERADDIYVDFDSFLKSAIYEYYQSGGKGRRANFIALVIASGEIASMALDSVRSGAGTKKLAVGAAGVLALRLGLRFLVGGPLGIILAGATAASLIAYFIRNRGQITEKIGRYRELVATIRLDYEKTQSDFRDGRFDRDQRNLMIDGLMKRFMERVNDDG